MDYEARYRPSLRTLPDHLAAVSAGQISLASLFLGVKRVNHNTCLIEAVWGLNGLTGAKLLELAQGTQYVSYSYSIWILQSDTLQLKWQQLVIYLYQSLHYSEFIMFISLVLLMPIYFPFDTWGKSVKHLSKIIGGMNVLAGFRTQFSIFLNKFYFF